MLIDCPSCLRSYQVGRGALGASGRSVVCPSCNARWFVAVPEDAVSQAGRIATSPLGPSPRRSERKTPASSFAPLAAAVLCLVLSMGLIGKRAAVVRAVPEAARLFAAIGLPVNARGLLIGEVTASRTSDETQRVGISGRIRNIAAARNAVPRITFDLRDAQGHIVASWSESPPKRTLARDEIAAFSTEAPASLPPGSKDVVVRFADGGS